jgi:uncharacterized membrane protein
MEDFNSLNSNDSKIDIGDMFSNGWNIFKQNIIGFVFYYILSIGLLLISAVTVVGPILLYMPLLMGFCIVADKIYRNQEYSFGSFLGGFRKIFGFLFYTVLISIIVGVIYSVVMSFYTPSPDLDSGANLSQADRGFFLPLTMLIDLTAKIFDALVYVLIASIPIIYLLMAFSFAPFLILFEDMGVIESMKVSFGMVNKHLLMMILCYIFIMIVSASGSIIGGVGMLVTAPIGYCMHLVLYRQLVPAN